MSDSQPSDASLLSRYQRGDRTAFATLAERHGLPLFNVILHQVGDRARAAELTRQALLNLASSAPTLDQPSQFSTWLYGMARALYEEEAGPSSRPGSEGSQRSRAWARMVERVGESSDRRQELSVARSGELRARVVDAVGELPATDREVYVLREIAQLPLSEIATVVGCDRDEVQRALMRALTALQSRVSGFEEYQQALR